MISNDLIFFTNFIPHNLGKSFKLTFFNRVCKIALGAQSPMCINGKGNVFSLSLTGYGQCK